MTNMTNKSRYYLSIKTGPEQIWMQPQGWQSDDPTEARAMARQADRQWMRVRLIDADTGRAVRYR